MTRYCIIGAGYAGLAAAKGFTDAGLDYDQFEAGDQVGGNWLNGVYDSTTMISSKDATAYEDLPMPTDYPMFPSRAQMLAYLQGYATHFGLDRRIRLNTLVEAVTPLDANGMSGWRVRLAGGEEREYAGVVVANGHYWKVNIPDYPGEFTGKQLHSKHYKNPGDVEGTRVLVVGGGNSGCDLAVESANTFGSADLSMRSGYWFLPKTMWGVPISALDIFYQPLWIQRLAMRAALRMTVGCYERYGLPKPNHALFDKDVTVNSTMMYAVQHGRVRPRPEISHYEGKRVHFVDGSSDEFDTILWATGFHTDFPFLDRDLFTWEKGQPVLLARVLPPGLANLYLWGNVAPRAGVGRTLTRGGRLLAELVLAQQAIDRPLADVAATVVRPRSSMLSGQGELLLLIGAMRRLLRLLDTADGLTRGAPSTVISRVPLPSRTPVPPDTKESPTMSLPTPDPHRRAVVTGASSGIGEALAAGLAKRGHSLIVVARREDRLRDLADRLNAEHGVTVEVLACDLADAESREKLAAELAGREISILCTNAGYATYGRLHELDAQHERDEVEVNVTAVHDLTLAVLPGMVARRSGAILVTGSTAGNQPSPHNATYAASKAFANTFAESLNGELAGTGVTCTLLAPGPVRTEFAETADLAKLEALPGFLWVTAEDAAELAIEGLSKGRRRVVPGLFAKAQTLGAAASPTALTNPILKRVYGSLK